ncbi:MAG: YitT family protein [Lachnospiraceae bacterium]|nr:YitT family protein [Lachnospiraceae bacterium]
MRKTAILDNFKRALLIITAAFLMAMNIKSFVRAGDLLPGGFSGLTLLIQQIAKHFWDIDLSYSLINFSLNAIPAFISFKYIGKKFTWYSCLMIVLTGIFTDVLSGFQMTNDILLVAVFGGILNACAISLCLYAHATSGGTDFIAIFFSEKFGIETWNYIFAGNCIILAIAGYLFGWNEALYSIIFQFTSTQVLHALYKRYQKQTLLIITSKPDEIYEEIREETNHDATLFKGIGCYKRQECNMLYSVVGKDEIKLITRKIKQIDPNAFINTMNTQQITGRFYQRPND